MIDLHSHILPDLDDGAGDMETSIVMARAAVRGGIQTMVATPHVNFDYAVDPEAIGAQVGALNVELARHELPLAVLPGAEVALSRLADLDDRTVRALCLGGGSCVLVESPYSRGVAFLEDLLFDLQLRGFQTLLAHPERCPIFQDQPDRLARLVERGVLCSVNTGSMAGRFGSTVRRFAIQLFRDELVHDVASDSHDEVRRPPDLRSGFEHVESELPGLSAQSEWFTQLAPAAILAGQPLPPRPRRPGSQKRAWRRFLPGR